MKLPRIKVKWLGIFLLFIIDIVCYQVIKDDFDWNENLVVSIPLAIGLIIGIGIPLFTIVNWFVEEWEDYI
jgi:hypothetical protein